MQAILAIPSRSPKKPRVISGINIFEKNHKADITKTAADTCQEQGIASQASVSVYKQTLWDMYQGADLDVKATCKEDANTMNNFCLEKPAPLDVYA